MVSVPQNVVLSAGVTLVVWRSVGSRSLKAIVPVSDRLGVVASSVTAPSASVLLLLIVGGLRVPVVTAVQTCALPLPLWPSLMVTVNFSVAVWPAARYWVAALETW